jgi:hypothetical protein
VKRAGPKNTVASVQARLVDRSRELGVEHQLPLARFGGEPPFVSAFEVRVRRPVHPQGRSYAPAVARRADSPHEDVDLLGFGDTSDEALKRVFVTLCAIKLPDDGLTFLLDSVQFEAIRADHEYGRMRVKLLAMLDNVRIPLQVDVGVGDAVVPPPEALDYP